MESFKRGEGVTSEAAGSCVLEGAEESAEDAEDGGGVSVACGGLFVAEAASLLGGTMDGVGAGIGAVTGCKLSVALSPAIIWPSHTSA